MSEYASSISQLLPLIVPLAVSMAPVWPKVTHNKAIINLQAYVPPACLSALRLNNVHLKGQDTCVG